MLSVLGKRITHCGPLGAGQTVKACNQILCALNMVGIVEALHLAGASGIPATTVLEALIPGAGGSWALEKLGPRIAAGDFAPGFMIRLIQKDLRIVEDMARQAGLPAGRHRHREGLLPGQRGGRRGRPGHPGHVPALARRRSPDVDSGTRQGRPRALAPAGEARLRQRDRYFFFRSSSFTRTRSTDHLGATNTSGRRGGDVEVLLVGRSRRPP